MRCRRRLPPSSEWPQSLTLPTLVENNVAKLTECWIFPKRAPRSLTNWRGACASLVGTQRRVPTRWDSKSAATRRQEGRVKAIQRWYSPEGGFLFYVMRPWFRGRRGRKAQGALATEMSNNCKTRLNWPGTRTTSPSLPSDDSVCSAEVASLRQSAPFRCHNAGCQNQCPKMVPFHLKWEDSHMF